MWYWIVGFAILYLIVIWRIIRSTAEENDDDDYTDLDNNGFI